VYPHIDPKVRQELTTIHILEITLPNRFLHFSFQNEFKQELNEKKKKKEMK